MPRIATLTLLAAAALATGRSPAMAEGISVRVAGRSPVQIHHDIAAAARAACRQAAIQDALDDDLTEDECVTATVDVAAAAASRIVTHPYEEADATPHR